MNRRELLRTLVIAVGAVAGKLIYCGSRSSPITSHSFHVAGVRFHAPVRGLRKGDPVRIVLSSFGEKPCYAVLSERGEKIGYVPQSEVSMLGGCRILRSYLSVVRNNAVPWKKLLVTVLTDANKNNGAQNTIA
jgi:hypothetical protein